MTKVIEESAQKELSVYLRSHDKQRLAQKSGVKLSKIEDMLAGTPIEEPLWQQVCKVIEADFTKSVFQTNDLAMGEVVADKAIKYHWRIGLTGGTGYGKSLIAEVLASERENVYLYRVEECTTPRIFLKGMLAVLREWFEGSVHAMLHRVAKRINSMDSPLLIIDECAKLSNRTILILHDLMNLTEGKCGMVLMGMPLFKNKLIHGRDCGKQGFAEFFRRINLWEELRGLTAKEVAYILEENGIAKDQHSEFRKINCMGDLLNKIYFSKAINNQL